MSDANSVNPVNPDPTQRVETDAPPRPRMRRLGEAANAAPAAGPPSDYVSIHSFEKLSNRVNDRFWLILLGMVGGGFLFMLGTIQLVNQVRSIEADLQRIAPPPSAAPDSPGIPNRPGRLPDGGQDNKPIPRGSDEAFITREEPGVVLGTKPPPAHLGSGRAVPPPPPHLKNVRTAEGALWAKIGELEGKLLELEGKPEKPTKGGN